MPWPQLGSSHKGKLVLFCACAVLTVVGVMALLRMAVILTPELYYGGFEGLFDAIAFQGFGPDKMRIEEG